jgi:hypothetical protein
MRFFLRKSMREVGTALGTTESGAKMRVHRALERLRRELMRRGAFCSPAGLATVLERSAVVPAPASLAGSITHHLSTTAVTPSLSLIRNLLLMSSFKAKSALTTALVLAFLAGGGVWLVQHFISHNAEPHPPKSASDPSSAMNSEPPKPRLASHSQVRTAGMPKTDAELGEARRALLEALFTPLPKSGISWPAPQVLEALAQFGPRQDLAFDVLREFLTQPDPPLETGDSPGSRANELARHRALTALGTFDRNLPGLRPFLWDLARSGSAGDESTSLLVLRQLGFDGADLPLLVDRLTHSSSRLLTVNRGLPQAIRQLAQTHPESFVPFAAELMGLLNHPDARIQLRAASALMGLPQGQDPRVVELLRSALKSGELEALIAIEAASAGGDPARSLIPDLMAYATAAERPHIRESALKAIASIQPDAIASMPEVAEVQARAAESEAIRNRVSSATRTFDDLVAGLREPSVAVTAATALADWGTAAASTLPALRSALAGMDEDSRDRIVEAMRRIDPSVQVERVPFDTVFSGVIHGSSVLPGQPLDPALRHADQLLMDYRMHPTWCTPEELTTLTQKLAFKTPSVAEAFLRGIADKDPALASRLRASLETKPAQP